MYEMMKLLTKLEVRAEVHQGATIVDVVVGKVRGEREQLGKKVKVRCGVKVTARRRRRRRSLEYRSSVCVV